MSARAAPHSAADPGPTPVEAVQTRPAALGQVAVMLFSVLVGLVAGLIVGGWLGAQYYVHMGPPGDSTATSSRDSSRRLSALRSVGSPGQWPELPASSAGVGAAADGRTHGHGRSLSPPAGPLRTSFSSRWCSPPSPQRQHSVGAPAATMSAWRARSPSGSWPSSRCGWERGSIDPLSGGATERTCRVDSRGSRYVPVAAEQKRRSGWTATTGNDAPAYG
jgi:hypothetical protein